MEIREDGKMRNRIIIYSIFVASFFMVFTFLWLISSQVRELTRYADMGRKCEKNHLEAGMKVNLRHSKWNEWKVAGVFK